MRKMVPLALIATLSILIGLMGTLGTRSTVLLSLGDLGITVFSFLALIAFSHDLTLGQSSSIRKIVNKIKSFLTEEEIYFGIKTGEYFNKIKTRIMQTLSADKAQNSDGIKDPDASADGHTPPAKECQDNLIKIPKSKTSLQNNNMTGRDNNESMDRTVSRTASWKNPGLSALYILFFMLIALWRIGRLFVVFPLAYTEQFGYSGTVTPGLPAAILLLFIYCFTVIYLKIRTSTPADISSYGMLSLFSLATLVYAAVIGINSVLNVNILVVLRWVYYTTSLYLIGALAFNILLSVFRNNVLGNFSYRILPKNLKIDNASGRFFDSEEVKLNFSLKSLYTFRYTLKILPGLILSLCLILLLSTTVFIVQPHQQAAVYRLGRLEQSSIVTEGIHLKLPWPLDVAEIYDVHRVFSLQIGYEAFDDTLNFLWDRFHDRSEYLLLLGNGNELVSVNMKIVYHISDLYSYLTTSTSPQAILSAASLAALMNRTANTTIDTFLSVDRDLLSASILFELSQFSDTENLGLSIIQIIIESIHPPVDIANVYQQVVSASVDKQTIIINAQSDSEKLLVDARRQNQVAVANALSEQHNRVSSAQSEMAVYYAAMEAHEINPGSFELSKYLDTFETVLGTNRVFVFSPGTEGSISRAITGRSNESVLWDLHTRRQNHD